MPLTPSDPPEGLKALIGAWIRTGPNPTGRNRTAQPAPCCPTAATLRSRPARVPASRAGAVNGNLSLFAGSILSQRLGGREGERVGKARTRLFRGFPPESRGVPPHAGIGAPPDLLPSLFLFRRSLFWQPPFLRGDPSPPAASRALNEVNPGLISPLPPRVSPGTGSSSPSTPWRCSQAGDPLSSPTTPAMTPPRGLLA